jgi:cytochrome c oxidase cbb3-type subunit 3
MSSRLILFVMLGLLGACSREDRSKVTDARAEGAAGGAVVSSPAQAQYASNAYQIGEGQRLYRWMNCSGCHGATGGGGMGVPLMDAEWRYGSSMADIVETIDRGRPNGMPAFHNRLTGQQMWQLAAYVRTLSGLAPKDAVPSRGDEPSNKAPITQRTPAPFEPAP